MEFTEQSTDDYKRQLEQINYALSGDLSETERIELQTVKETIQELLALTSNNGEVTPERDKNLDDEYALFQAELAKEGALNPETHRDLNALEGTKCRAPHTHQWGTTVYHNALITSVINPETPSEDLQVRVLFTNPTHKEMLPCPYFLEEGCKFTPEKCRFSHGEPVLFSSLQDYEDPDFETLSVGACVLGKQSDNLWYRGSIKNIQDGTCLVKFESSNFKDARLELKNVLPLNCEQSDSEENDDDLLDNEDVINASLLNPVSEEKLGNWEKHTKGIGSKLMEKMGYVIGTGLGRKSDGRLSPVTAVILPAGKSLDHCMKLRERSGGDKDLFSVERRLKRLKKKQEMRNEKAYERAKRSTPDVFTFLNETLSTGCAGVRKSESDREAIKKETARSLNVASLKVDEEIRRVEREIYVVRESLTRHTDVTSKVNKNLNEKFRLKELELESLKKQATNIKNEQRNRDDKRKLTVF